MEITLLIVLIALQSVTLIALVAAVVLYVHKANEAVREFGQAAKEIRDCITPVAEDLRRAVNDTDDLVLAAKSGVESVSRLAGSVERFVEVGQFFQTAEKAVTSSRTTVVSLIEGLKAGLHALKSSKDNSKEGYEDVE